MLHFHKDQAKLWSARSDNELCGKSSLERIARLKYGIGLWNYISIMADTVNNNLTHSYLKVTDEQGNT